MPLIEYDLFGAKIDKVSCAIDRIRAFCPEEGYFVAFSGGKDSVVVKALCDMAGVKYDAHYSVTTVDPPELVRFIREKHPDAIFDRPEMSMRQLIIWAATHHKSANSSVGPCIKSYTYTHLMICWRLVRQQEKQIIIAYGQTARVSSSGGLAVLHGESHWTDRSK